MIELKLTNTTSTIIELDCCNLYYLCNLSCTTFNFSRERRSTCLVFYAVSSREVGIFYILHTVFISLGPLSSSLFCIACTHPYLHISLRQSLVSVSEKRNHIITNTIMHFSPLFWSTHTHTIRARAALGAMLLFVPALCLSPAYLTILTIDMFTDSLALQDKDYDDMM